MTSENLLNPEDISQLRNLIDQYDAQIAHLLVKRTQIAQKVAASKANDAKIAGEELGFGWRPKREIEIIRQVLRHEPTLGKRLSYMVWRAMITRNLANQAPMEVLCVKESQAPSRIGFGAAIVPSLAQNAQEAIKTAKEKDNLIISLPWPSGDQNWWLELIKPEYSDLKINMALPHIEGAMCEALCLAKITPLETQNDYSIIAAKKGVSFGLTGLKISESDGYELWQIAGFHEEIENLEIENPQSNIHFLGAYAIV